MFEVEFVRFEANQLEYWLLYTLYTGNFHPQNFHRFCGSLENIICENFITCNDFDNDQHFNHQELPGPIYSNCGVRSWISTSERAVSFIWELLPAFMGYHIEFPSWRDGEL